MDRYIIAVNGVPFYLIIDGNGFYVFAVAQTVNINGSPLIVSFDPPIAPTVNAAEVAAVAESLLPRT